MVGQRLKQSIDVYDRYHHYSGAERCDLEHRFSKNGAVISLDPLECRFVECLGASSHDVACDLGEYEGARRRHDQSTDQEKANCSEERSGSLDQCAEGVEQRVRRQLEAHWCRRSPTLRSFCRLSRFPRVRIHLHVARIMNAPIIQYSGVITSWNAGMDLSIQ